jgi:hypothetical protein
LNLRSSHYGNNKINGSDKDILGLFGGAKKKDDGMNGRVTSPAKLTSFQESIQSLVPDIKFVGE